ncbi:hypothetical protein DFP74_1151 [Nocardiopsis sp. Huas11]|uniref:hypothetical protein n=1 Tax=Nocardiopsis sp. Huas11 TaxID=2183912 RepID=UPI000EB194FE|nr:hypothetical protein [Nocardiopsis sp. Huas11]RKS05551.1 hypothetical protein DFP74_1151 [Nocardiopsis sp. Huas11]
MPPRTQFEPTTLPRRTRPTGTVPAFSARCRTRSVPACREDLPPLPAETADLSAAVRALLRHRPDLAHPANALTDAGTPPVSVLIADLLVSLTEVHRLALTIGADHEAADIGRLIDTLRTTS